MINIFHCSLFKKNNLASNDLKNQNVEKENIDGEIKKENGGEGDSPLSNGVVEEEGGDLLIAQESAFNINIVAPGNETFEMPVSYLHCIH